MRDRKPYNLKNAIVIYNVSQILMSIYLVYEVSIVNIIYFQIYNNGKCLLIIIVFVFPRVYWLDGGTIITTPVNLLIIQIHQKLNGLVLTILK